MDLERQLSVACGSRDYTRATNWPFVHGVTRDAMRELDPHGFGRPLLAEVWGVNLCIERVLTKRYNRGIPYVAGTLDEFLDAMAGIAAKEISDEE